MYKHILLPLDGSSLAEQAIPHAIAQANSFDAELIIVKEVEPLGERVHRYSTTIEQAEKDTLAFVEGYLKKIAKDVR